MSDLDHIVIEGEAVTLDPAQVDYCSSQDRQVNVVVDKLPSNVAAEVIFLDSFFFDIWETLNLTLVYDSW